MNLTLYYKNTYSKKIALTESLKQKIECFKKGDIIVDINGQKINTLLDLRLELYKYKAGDTITLTVYRDNKEITVDELAKIANTINRCLYIIT